VKNEPFHFYGGSLYGAMHNETMSAYLKPVEHLVRVLMNGTALTCRTECEAV